MEILKQSKCVGTGNIKREKSKRQNTQYSTISERYNGKKVTDVTLQRRRPRSAYQKRITGKWMQQKGTCKRNTLTAFENASSVKRLMDFNNGLDFYCVGLNSFPNKCKIKIQTENQSTNSNV